MSLLPPPLYTDENVDGALVRALVRLGWDVVRAVDVQPPGTDDTVHFQAAVEQGRVLVSQDSDMLALAARWHADGKAFAGLVFLVPHKFRSVGDALRAMQVLVSELDRKPLRNRVHFL